MCSRRYVDWRDRGTCILFGDGCGAMVLTATEKPEDCCLLGFDMHSDGTGNHNLTAQFVNEAGTETDGKSKPTADAEEAASGRGAFCNISMNGQEVFKFAGADGAGHAGEESGQGGNGQRGRGSSRAAPGEPANHRRAAKSWA